MEEHVGQVWDKLVTRFSDKSYQDATVSLSEIAKPLGIFFRALGGDNALRC